MAIDEPAGPRIGPACFHPGTRRWPGRLGFAAAFIVIFGLPVPVLAEADCLESADKQQEIDECFHRLEAIEARKLSVLMRELANVLKSERNAALIRNHKHWRRHVVRQCRWESTFFAPGPMAHGVLGSCVAEHMASRASRLKRFLCEDAGVSGPCEASRQF